MQNSLVLKSQVVFRHFNKSKKIHQGSTALLKTRQFSLVVSQPLSKRKLFSISSCAKKKDDEVISTKKKEDGEPFGQLLKAAKKAILTNAGVYDAVSKNFGSAASWILPFLSAVLELMSTISFNKSESLVSGSNKFLSSGDLISFPHGGSQVIGEVIDLDESITVVRVRRGRVRIDNDKVDCSLICNLTMKNDKAETMWGINIDVECGNGKTSLMIQEIQSILKAQRLINPNAKFNRVYLDHSLPLKIVVTCYVKMSKLKPDPLTGYLDLRCQLLHEIKNVGRVIT